MQSDRFEKDGIELVVVDPLEGSEVVPMDIKRSKRDLHAVEVPLTRQKRAKRRKRCKVFYNLQTAFVNYKFHSACFPVKCRKLSFPILLQTKQQQQKNIMSHTV